MTKSAKTSGPARAMRSKRPGSRCRPLIRRVGAKPLNNWLANDYLHFRQITKLNYDYAKQLTGEALDYAGNW